MKLSKNFTMKEFTKSTTATRLGIDNTPEGEHLEAAKELFTHVIQPTREEHGKTTLTSGYRSPELNTAVGGSSKSQHCKGEACDFECDLVDNLEVAHWIKNNLEFDQLISEFYEDDDPSSGWIHASYVSPEKNRKQCLTAQRVDGRTQYVVGLPVLLENVV
jgi:zinc D-Ala-D-Ala carboxypeptidase